MRRALFCCAAMRVPDGTTLLKFRRLLEQHKLGEALFAKVGESCKHAA
jgi:IS5 family transposase